MITCTHCDKTFSTKAGLSSHLRMLDKAASPNNSTETEERDAKPKVFKISGLRWTIMQCHHCAGVYIVDGLTAEHVTDIKKLLMVINEMELDGQLIKEATR